jgi:sulfite reductase (NADPH) hemoprotein beta-component
MTAVHSADFMPGRVGFAREADVDLFVEMLGKYERGEITAAEWRAFRLVNGVYGIRQPDQGHMLRVKIPQGIAKAEHLRLFATIAQRYGGRAHVTTRQNFQFYFVPLAEAPGVLRELAALGISTREACGNSVRNITCNPLAGVDPDEVFDVTPYADALTRHLIRGPLSSSLPRKFKIGFESSRRDEAKAPINDLAFLARLGPEGPDGKRPRGFRVLAAGGTSTLNRSAQLLVDFLPAGEIFTIADAVVRVFHREGERNNKAKARLKWLVKKIGWAAFVERVETERRAVIAEGKATPLPFDPDAPPVEPIPEVSLEGLGDAPPPDAAWLRTNVVKQKQPGRVAAYITLTLGDLTPRQLEALAGIVERFSDGTLRLTAEQNVVIRHVPEAALPALYRELSALGLGAPGAGGFADVTSCAGADTCSIAVTASRGLGRLLDEALLADPLIAAAARGEATGLDGASIKVSGCPNGCGQHHIASISLQGGMRKLDGKALPMYHLSVGGGTERDAEGYVTGLRFARLATKVPARRAPEAVRRIVALWRRERPDISLDNYLATVETGLIKKELEDLSAIDEKTAHPLDFVDLGQEAPFEVIEGESECAS